MNHLEADARDIDPTGIKWRRCRHSLPAQPGASAFPGPELPGQTRDRMKIIGLDWNEEFPTASLGEVTGTGPGNSVLESSDADHHPRTTGK